MFICRMIFAAICLVVYPNLAGGEEVSLRCSWARATTGFGTPLDPAMIEAGKLYDPDSPIRLFLDIEKSKLRFALKSDDIIFGFGNVLALDDRIRIEFEAAKIQGLAGRRSKLSIFINRYDLSSTLILGFWEEKKGYVAQWLRRGSCQKQII